jgi:hypothetical protein
MSTELTVCLRVRADHSTCQTLLAVAVFVLFTINYGLLFWMIAAVIFVNHGGSNLVKNPGPKDPALNSPRRGVI